MLINMAEDNFITLGLRHADKPAVVTSSTKSTWNQLAVSVHTRRSALHQLGLKKGDKCAIFASPSADYVETLFALWALGAIAVPMNTRLPHAQLFDMLRQIKCSYVISDTINLPEPFKTIQLAAAQSNDTSNTTEEIKFLFDAPATIIFTSGSTGRGKACQHTIGNHVFSAAGSNQNISLLPGESWLLSLPLYHVAGIAVLFRCLLSGAAIAIPTVERSLAENILRLEPTHLSLVATQLQQLVQQPALLPRLQGARAILLGGSAFPQPLITKALDFKLPIYKSYGSTEMASQITTTGPNEAGSRFHTSGKLLPYRDLTIKHDGEILVKGKTLFQGYLQDDQIFPIVDKDGWFHTGDLGRIDEQGYLTVLGRKDNMFISGGENIYPEEIERVLESYDGIEQAFVVPVENDTYGQRPVAFIKLKADYKLSDFSIDELRTRLPGYKIPDHFFVWPNIEDGLKPDRTALKNQAEELVRR